MKGHAEVLKEANKVLSLDSTLSTLLHIDINLPYYDGDVNAYLYSSIISQQLSTKAADAIYARFLEFYGGNTPDSQQLLDTEIEDLRLIGLSKAKSNYLRNVANYFKDDPIDSQHWHTLENEKVIESLTAIKGVGVWTVQMVLIFCLARKDIFPILDLGVRNSAIALYGLEGEKKEINKKLLEIAEGWKPYRTIASLYLWAWRNSGMKNG